MPLLETPTVPRLAGLRCFGASVHELYYSKHYSSRMRQTNRYLGLEEVIFFFEHGLLLKAIRQIIIHTKAVDRR